MPDVEPCPACGNTVSRRTIACRQCGATINAVPTTITIELLDSLLDDDLADFLFQYASTILADHGCFQMQGPRCADVLATLPSPIRMGYTLVVLDSEVNNGGFYQFFTNSSGQVAHETLEDLRLIGAEEHAVLVETAIRLNERLEDKFPHYKRRFEDPHLDVDPQVVEAFWSDVESNLEPQFERLSDDFCELQHTQTMWSPFSSFIRDRVGECVHNRGMA